MKNKTILLISLLMEVVFLATACSNSPKPTQAVRETNRLDSTKNSPTQMAAADQKPLGAKTQSLSFGKPTPVNGTFAFAEGPAADQQGNIYFSDINAGRIYKWSPGGNLTVFLNGLNKPNGLEFDPNGMLITCEGGNGRLISINPQGQITVLANQYNGVRFNEPNDLWIDPQGGIYFTDPAYQSPVVQDGENVYYLSPDRNQVIRVIDDMVRPNGIVGTADGKVLYVSDHGAGKTFSYNINPDGTLTNKQLFISVGSDGMTVDKQGNLYVTTPNQIQVFDTQGNHLLNIPTKENPTNVTFIDKEGQTLFITARTAAYTVQVLGDGSSASADSTAVSHNDGFALTSPDAVEGGTLPAEYTCDGTSSTLALTWSGAPEGTVGYAVIMHHVASPEDVHWYWALYNIPANITSLSKNSTGIGTLGTNSVNGKTEYTPPCSKGPGPKMYTYTVYALAAQPQFTVPASQVNRDVLLKAIQNITLASAELHVIYTRK